MSIECVNDRDYEVNKYIIRVTCLNAWVQEGRIKGLENFAFFFFPDVLLANLNSKIKTKATF